MEEVKVQQQSKWEGKVTAELEGTPADQAWQPVADFCNLHKWLPTISTCHLVGGSPDQPGAIRYCSTAPIDNNDSTVKFVKEVLLTFDPIGRSLSYEITENNIGFKSYAAKMQVVPMDGEDGASGCKIEWSFVCDPIEGYGLDDFVAYLDFGLQGMGERIMEHVTKSASR